MQAVEAFTQTLGTPLEQSTSADNKYKFFVSEESSCEGIYYCYEVSYEKVADGKKRSNKRNVIYDAANDHILTLEDAFTLEAAAGIRMDGGNAFYNMKLLRSGSLAVSYKKDGKLHMSFYNLGGDKDKLTPLMCSFLEQGMPKNEFQFDEGGETDNRISTIVEQMPSFPGGDAAMSKYLSTHLHYPPEAFKNRIQGRVTCQFVVETDGSITDARVVRGVDPDLDREALRVIKSMPKWIPGKTKGLPLRVRFTCPINFTL